MGRQRQAMNVLLTSIGRRSYLVDYFRQALAGRGRVYAANSVADTPGMLAADGAFGVPPAHDPGYGEAILRLCQAQGVGLLCSCHDLDTLVLADQRAELARQGVTAVLPEPEWARVGLDKWVCGNRLRAAGFNVPWSVLTLVEAEAALARGEVRFPLVVKARYGFGSLGLAYCRDREELAWYHGRAVMAVRDSVLPLFGELDATAPVLVQEAVSGPEWCVTLVNDLAGHPVAHFITEVHVMRAGESDRATTLPTGALGALPARLAALIRHAGVCGVDIRLADGQPVILDINPRFTGDYPFQHLAGADLPAVLVAWALGQSPDPAWLRPRAGVTGYKDLVPRLARSRCNNPGSRS